MAHETEIYQIALGKNKLCMKRLPIKLYIFFLHVFFIIFKEPESEVIRVETCSYLLSLYCLLREGVLRVT
jgi:hypothetical protein